MAGAIMHSGYVYYRNDTSVVRIKCCPVTTDQVHVELIACEGCGWLSTTAFAGQRDRAKQRRQSAAV